MIKLVCYGVRETEVKYFEEINKKIWLWLEVTVMLIDKI